MSECSKMQCEIPTEWEDLDQNSLLNVLISQIKNLNKIEISFWIFLLIDLVIMRQISHYSLLNLPLNPL